MIRRFLGRVLFPAVPPERLALLRIAIGLYAVQAVYFGLDSLDYLGRSPALYFEPVGLATLLDGPLDPALHRVLLQAVVVLGVLFVLGVRHAVVGPLFGFLLLFVLCYRNSWSMIFHSANLVVLHVAILGVTPSASALSVDAWLARRFPGRAARLGAWPSLPKGSHWMFGWPVQLVGLVTLLTYFLAGLAKVAGPLGIGWASAQTLQRQIAVDALRKDLLSDGARDLAFRLYEQDELLFLLAAGSLALELFAPVFLVTARTARLWAVGAFLFHWGVFFIMGIKFEYQRWGLPYLSFFPLERILARPRRWLSRLRPAPGPPRPAAGTGSSR